MDAERFARLREIVLTLSRLPASERAARLDVECRDDPELRHEAESLLEWDEVAEPSQLEPAARAAHVLSFQPGYALAHYRLLEEIGSGGMGVVWRARDTRLDREVAIKVLSAALAVDPHRIARFEREAKAIAALNHPTLIAIHDFGREGEIAYAVTELIEGQTLRRRLENGPLSARKVADLGAQMARGLAAAHARGIVHRDLKPENVIVTREGRAKILDFGLAALLPSGGTEGSTKATPLSIPGMIFGTAAYMSPEQARGDPVDHRSDVFSLGAVMYEMLSGRNPFERETNAETMAAVVREEPPDLSEAGWRGPAALDRTVRRCLEKRPEERFQSASDLAFAIESAIDTSGDLGRLAAVAGWRVARRGRLLIAAGLVTFGLASGAVLMSAIRSPDVSAPAPTRVRTLTFSGSDRWPAPSPDGRTIAFSSERDGRSRIWIKHLSTGGEQPITTGDDVMPSFSPDGSSILFLRAEGGTGNLYRQALVGGEPRRLVRDVLEARWSPDGRRIAFLRVLGNDQGWKTAIGVADAKDGSERQIADSPQRLYGIGWSPDGREIYATETVPRGIAPDFSLFVVDASSGKWRRQGLGPTATVVSPAIWNGDGRDLLFARAGSLVGDQGNSLCRVVRYQPKSGRERTLFFAEHLFPSIGGSARPGRLEIVSAGTVVFSAATVRENLFQFPAVSGGTSPETPRLTRGQSRDRQPAISPDGGSVLFASNRSGNLDLWLANSETGGLHQITDDAAQDWDPGFSPDGKRIVWSSDRGGHLEIWTAAVDGSGARQVTHDGLDAENPTMTRDGKWIVYWSSHPQKRGLWRIRADGTEATRITAGQYALPEVSPDGRWVSYVVLEPNNLRNVIRVVSFDDGRPLPFEILVPAPFNRPDDVVLGRHRWLPDGNGIAFVGFDERGHTDLFVQDFRPGVDLGSLRRPLVGRSLEFDIESFDISPDGQTIVAAALEASRRLMLAEAVPGVFPRR